MGEIPNIDAVRINGNVVEIGRNLFFLDKVDPFARIFNRY